MDKKIAGLLGAVAALTSLPAAQAAAVTVDPAQAMQAASYADLLTPVPNAVAVLQADDIARAQQQGAETEALDGVQVAQYHDHHHHHRRVIIMRRHHHHHHNWRRMRRHHHHHHHHSFLAIPRDDA